ncbi:MAG TPA: peptidoglycan bridge formation glycyltransferase FemA/FemB family protein [Patescibacteria group bacterium]|nr:peptidoglycan bridge formation glycyltransferase FemA/FemB family protein [Patescibacteria group bacterium]
MIREISPKDKNAYDKLATHVIQSWEWGEFRKKMGTDIARLGEYSGNKLTSAYQLTFHPVPFFKNVTIGYFPKGPMPTKTMLNALVDLGAQKKAAFIKIEPLQQASGQTRDKLLSLGLVESKKSLFTKYNFLVDLTQSEENLLANMHSKTRYNIKLAQKKGVKVYDSTADSDFKTYLKLYFDTTRRQKYFGHSPAYHQKVWETLKPAKMARVLIAQYQKKPLVAWMLLNFGDTIYYPYGGSSLEHKEVMASNLIAWEAIRLGKRLNFTTFDMWGALPPDADKTDPWYGFHRFKEGYGGNHVEYIGTYDLVLRPRLYTALNLADKLRWSILRATRG